MANLYEILKERMSQFKIDLPFAIKELKVDEEGELCDNREERVQLHNNQIIFELSVDNSYPMLNELVAKVKLGLQHGELMTTQTFSKPIDRKLREAFFKATSPLVNAYAFKCIQRYLSSQSFMKEKMEWQGYYKTILEISMTEASEEITMMLVSLYVTLKSSRVINIEIPNRLKVQAHAINVYLELLEEEPSPYYMASAVNRVSGGKYYCAVDQKEGKEVFIMRETTREDFYDIA